MAYTPAYSSKINWQNEPSEATALNDVNLNKMDDAIYTIDQRVVELDGKRETDETKLATIETGAQVNTVTGVKGNSEGSYRVGNVNITKANIGLGNVDNTSDANKPVSTATQTALNGKVDKEAGKGLSSNDYTTTEKNKLAGISANATAVSISDTLQDGDTIANITINGTTTAIKAKQPNEQEMNARSAMMLLSSSPISENAPFVKRRSGGNVPFPALLKDKIIGASVVWNQLVALNEKTWTVGTADSTRKDLTDTVVANHVYYICAYQKQTMTSNTRNTFYHKVGTSYTYQASLSNYELSAGVKFWVYKPESNGVFGFWTNAPSVETTYDNAMCFDLTAMFSNAPSIADYVYTLESGTAGSGIAWLKSYGFFTEPYYAYSANKIESVSVSAKKNVGFNQWDEVWELGSISPVDGSDQPSTTNIRSKNYIPVTANTSYFLVITGNVTVAFRYYDFSKSLVGTGSRNGTGAFTIPNGVSYMRFVVFAEYGTTYNHDICINISNASLNGQYKPYTETTYSLDHTTQRGLFKLDANNNLYADGDIYPSSGTESVKYALVDLGTLNWARGASGSIVWFTSDVISELKKTTTALWDGYLLCEKYVTAISATSSDDKTIRQRYDGSNVLNQLVIFDSSYSDSATFKTAMSGVYLLYELATPTTASLTPYSELQNIASGGTEEFIDYGVSQGTRDVPIPVGGDRQYYQGMDLPALPTALGNHNLQFNPSSGFSWS